MSEAVDGWLTVLGKKPALGSFGPAGGSMHKRLNYRNSFRTMMYLRFEPAGSGCRIIARSFMSVWALAFMMLWFGVLGSSVVTGLGMLVTSVGDPLPMMLLAPGLMMLFGVALVIGGRWMARDEHAFLLGLLVEELDGVQQADPRSRTGGPIVS
ncbi:MAG: hypothetical protein GC145_09645 [Caulobacter sp.]|nr:hypothetical protein [Caulobacter sp.]